MVTVTELRNGNLNQDMEEVYCVLFWRWNNATVPRIFVFLVCCVFSIGEERDAREGEVSPPSELDGESSRSMND